MPSFGGCVDFRRRTRHKLESGWSRGVFVGVSKNNRAQCHGRDRDVCCEMCETPCEPNPGDVSTDLPEPMLIIPQLPAVTSTFARRTSRDLVTLQVFVRVKSIAPVSTQQQFRRRLEDAMTTDTSAAARVEATRVRQAEQNPAVRAVRVVLLNTSVFDLETRNLWSQGLNAMPKCRLAARRHQ